MPSAEKLAEFVQWCSQHVTGDEKGEAQLYLERLFQAFGHAGLKEAEATLEFHMAKAAEAGGGTAFADLVWKPVVLVEMKKRGVDLQKHYWQDFEYWTRLVPNRPRSVGLCSFNGTVQETHEFTNDQIDRPENLALLRAVFSDPDFLKPQRTTNEVTKQLAGQFAQVARSLHQRESAELADAGTRAEVTVAQRQNLRIARFLNRLVFCFFAEGTGLLPKGLFSDLARSAPDDPRQFAQALESLFRTMAKGGLFGHHKLRHFNGHIFEDATVFELTDAERRLLMDAAEAD